MSLVCKQEEFIKLHAVKKFDILGNLCREIAFKVLISLSPEDIDTAFKCCKKWRENMNYELFWKTLYKREFVEFDEEPNTEIYTNNLLSISLYWQRRYWYTRTFQHNVENKAYLTVPIRLSKLRPTFIYLDNRMLILSAEFTSGKKVVIIDSSTGLVEKELLFAPGYSKIIKHENLLIAITKNFHLKVWEIDSCMCIINVEMDYNFDVVARELLACKQLILITGIKGNDSFLFVFNMETQNFNFLGKDLFVFCTNDTIAIAEKNGIVELLDTNLKSRAKFNCFKASYIFRITMNNDFLVKSYLHTEPYMSVWNIKTKANFRIRLEQCTELCCYLIGNKLVCMTDSNRCEVWDLHAQNCLFKIDTKNSIYNIIVLSNRYIVLCYFGPEVFAVYSIQNGALIMKYGHNTANLGIRASTNTKLLEINVGHCTWKILDFERTQD